MSKKRLSTVSLDEETYNRCRDVAAALSGPPNFMTISRLVGDALQTHLRLMEELHNKGNPFPKFEGKVKTGRPMGS